MSYIAQSVADDPAQRIREFVLTTITVCRLQHLPHTLQLL